VPVKIQEERRFNNRNHGQFKRCADQARINQSIDEKKKNIETFLKWAKGNLTKNPGLLEDLPQRKYVNGEMLNVGKFTFRINIFYHETQKSTPSFLMIRS